MCDVCLSVCLCVDSAKMSNRRAVTAAWSLPRQSSHRSRRRPSAIAAAAAAGDVIDDDDDMDDDGLSYFSLPLDIKPPDCFVTTVSWWSRRFYDINGSETVDSLRAQKNPSF